MSDDVHKWAEGLRELADFAEQRPELFDGNGETFNLFAYTPEGMTEKARLLGTSEKHSLGSYYVMRRYFGPHKLELNIAHEQFCERVQTGTKTVTKPDPEALRQVPNVEIEEPVYEWICPKSVLKDDDE